MSVQSSESTTNEARGARPVPLGRPSRRRLPLITLAATLLFASPAHAYLDAGTGTMILQIILGGIAGAAVAGRLYWQRLKAFIGIAADEEATETEASRATTTSPGTHGSNSPRT